MKFTLAGGGWKRTYRVTTLALCALGVVLAGAKAQVAPGGVRAQNAPNPPNPPAFDVVSIRPTNENDHAPTHISNSPRNGQLRAVNVNLKAFMEVAYDLADLRMSGGPDWTGKETFSLEAKADPDLDARLAALPPAEGRQIKRDMLAALLADRFKLKVHTESRRMPVYTLLVAKSGSRLGQAGVRRETPSAGGDRIVVLPGGKSLEQLAYELSWRLGRPVIDQTGLQYRGECRLSFEELAGASADSGQPSVFTAIQEQLGLRLEPGIAPVPMLIIDHAERPTGN